MERDGTLWRERDEHTGGYYNMSLPFPSVPQIPRDLNLNTLNLTVTTLAEVPYVVCQYGQRSCANGCLVVFVERDSGNVAAILQLLRVGSEQSSNGTLLTALLKANYTVLMYALDGDTVLLTDQSVEAMLGTPSAKKTG